MGRKITFVLIAVLGTCALAAMSREAKDAYLAKIRRDLQLSRDQVVKIDKLLDELEPEREKVSVAIKESRDKGKAAKQQFSKRQEDGFRAILTPEQFEIWKKRYLPPANPPAHVHHQ